MKLFSYLSNVSYSVSYMESEWYYGLHNNNNRCIIMSFRYFYKQKSTRVHI